MKIFSQIESRYTLSLFRARIQRKNSLCFAEKTQKEYGSDDRSGRHSLPLPFKSLSSHISKTKKVAKGYLFCLVRETGLEPVR